MAWPMLGSLLLACMGCSGVCMGCSGGSVGPLDDPRGHPGAPAACMAMAGALAGALGDAGTVGDPVGGVGGHAQGHAVGGAGGDVGDAVRSVVVDRLQECVTPGAATVEGIDVFDGQGAIDWAAVADSGVAFALIKSTQGTYDTQATFAANWTGARRAGIRRGAYHFFDPTEDGAAQAQRFLGVVGPLAAGDLPPMLDIECPDGDPDCLGTGEPGTAPPDAIASRMEDWLHAVQAATGAKPIVYTFGSYFASSGVATAGLEAYPLFLAQPTPTPPGDETCLDVPAPWTKATLWQYSWTGVVSGIDVPVDRDRYLGTSAALEALALGSGAAGSVGAIGSGSAGALGSGGAGSAGVPGSGAMSGSSAELADAETPSLAGSGLAGAGAGPSLLDPSWLDAGDADALPASSGCF